MLTLNHLVPTHHDLRRQYDCAATMTVATFVVHGVAHRARRFWREDMPTSGKIELYTLSPYPGEESTSLTEYGWYSGTTCEDFLRYVDRDNPSAVDDIAIAAIRGAIAQRAYLNAELERDQEARFGLLELD